MGSGALPTAWGLTPFFKNEAFPKAWFQFSSDHSGIVQFAFADGSVRSIMLGIEFWDFVRLSAMHDGELFETNAIR